MRHRYLSPFLGLSAIFGVLAIGSLLTSSVFAESDTEKSLYDRLGGYEAVSAVVDDFAAKLFDDPVVGARFFGMGDDTRESFRQKNKNLVCAATGGPCKIISRPAATVHGGLGIKASEFNIVAQHLVDTLNKFNVPEKEHNELMAIVGSLRPDIVEVEDVTTSHILPRATLTTTYNHQLENRNDTINPHHYRSNPRPGSRRARRVNQ